MQAIPAALRSQGIPVFALKAIGKHYGAVRACQNITFDIYPGDIIGLAGENGAGKSTSMKCLAGWVPPSAGHIECDGAPVTFAGPRDAERAGIAVIPQELDLFPELPIYENIFAGVQWPRNRWGIFDRSGMKETAKRLLAQLGARFDVGVSVKSLSPASQKMVQIARALNLNARLLIMDEPTAALTEIESAKLFRVIHDLQSQGTAIIHITHRLDEIFNHCNRIVILRDGEMTGAGEVPDFDTVSLIEAMVGRQVDQFYTRRFRRQPGETMLEARGLSRVGVYQDVDLALHAGEVLGVAGLIGAGRTEIAHAIAGVRPADKGEILVKGQAVRLRSVTDAMCHGIAYLPEERRSQGLHLSFPIAWNMTFGALPKITSRGLINAVEESRLTEATAKEFVVRAPSLDLPVASLSGGNQQKVLLAKALANDPDVIILDEPTRGVDVGAKAEIYALIETLVEQGKAVMLISSEIEEVLALSDRIATVHHGRINRILDRAEFSANAIGFAVSGQVQHA
jgi:ABC-type sugar transport system ATPase subunit